VLTDRLSRPDAEAALVGAMLYDNHIVADVAAVVEPAAFVDGFNLRVFEATLKLRKEGQGVDLVTLRHAMNLDADEVVQLTAILENCPASANWRDYAALVNDAAIRRRVETVAKQAAHEARTGDTAGVDLATRLHDDAAALLASGTGPDVATAGDAVDELVERLRRAEAGEDAPISTGLEALDSIIGGLEPGRLSILAARPFSGKTVLALNIALAAAGAGGPVLYIGMEQGATELAGLAQCVLGGPLPGRLKTGRLTREEYSAWQSAAPRLRALPLWLADATNVTAASVGRMARGMKGGTPVLIVVDYLQLMAMGKAERRDLAIADVTRSLKLLSRELHTHVLLLAQLNRQPENRPDRTPRMSDLRESGAIEQDADEVVLLHRPCLGLAESELQERRAHGRPAEDDYAVLFVCKNRQTGVVKDTPVGWDASRLSFTDNVPVTVEQIFH